MDFRFLYDPQRRIFSIGYRLADAEGPGRLDASYYDLLASEARLASFLAIAKGDVPQAHWFHLGRLLTSVDGSPTLLSWSATLFEYLMPLLVMRSYPETLLDQTCRMAVRRQIEVRGRARRAVGHLGVGVQRRRPPRQLPVQGLRRPGPRPQARPGRRPGGGALRDRRSRPWWTRRARRGTSGGWREEGLEGAYGFYEAIDYTRVDDGEEIAAAAATGAGPWSAPTSPTTRA